MQKILREFQIWLDLTSDSDQMSLEDYRQLLMDIIGECEDRLDAATLDIDEDEEDET